MQENQQDTNRILTPEQIKVQDIMQKINALLEANGMMLVPIFKFDGMRLDARCGIQMQPKLGPNGLPVMPEGGAK